MTTELVELADRWSREAADAVVQSQAIGRDADAVTDLTDAVTVAALEMLTLISNAHASELRALASRAGGSEEVSAWRELYQLQTAMRYMDNRIGKRAAYRMAEEDVQRMTAQLAETAKAAAPEPGAVGSSNLSNDEER